jgi:hypothetical protein
MRNLLPLSVAALLAGALLLGPAFLSPGQTAPETTFTLGHLAGLGVAAESIGSVHSALVGGGADVRPLLWPAVLAARVVGPVLAFNLTILLIPAFNAATLYGAARVLGAGPAGAAVAGLLGVMDPWVRTTVLNGQVEQAPLGGAAAIWAAFAWAATGSARRAWAPMVVTAGVGLAAPHVALAGCAGLVAFAHARVGTLGAVAGAAVGAWAVHAWHAPGFDGSVHLFAPLGSEPEAPAGLVAKVAARPLEFVWPPPPLPRWANGVAHATYVGAPLLLGTAWAALRHAPARRPALAATLLLLLSLGEATPLWRVLAGGVPEVARSDTPYRFVLGVFAAGALALATVPRLGLLVACAGFIEAFAVDRRPWPRPLSVAEDATTALVTAGPVLDLPINAPTCRNMATHAVLEASRHRQPVPLVLGQGFLAYPRWGAQAMAMTRALEEGDCPAVERLVREGGFATVVAHTHVKTCRLRRRGLDCVKAAFGRGIEVDGGNVWTVE